MTDALDQHPIQVDVEAVFNNLQNRHAAKERHADMEIAQLQALVEQQRKQIVALTAELTRLPSGSPAA